MNQELQSNLQEDPSQLAADTDQAIQGLLPEENSFAGLSPEDAKVLHEWGQEARSAHMQAIAANAGARATSEMVSAPAEAASDDRLVTVGNATLTQGALKRYEAEGQEIGGAYNGNRRA